VSGHVRSWFGILVVGYFGLYAFAWLVSESMMYHPPRERIAPRGEILRIPVTHEEAVAAVYRHAPGSDVLLLYSHGNGEDLGQLDPLLDLYTSRGYSVLAYDYRGYGLSDGSPGERNTYRDIDAVYAYATNTLGYAPSAIIAYGRSIGTGPSTWLAANRDVGGLVLESGFSSIFRVVTGAPVFPIDRYPNGRRLASVTAPVFVLHGRADATIPFEHGERLYRLATSPKTNLWVDGAGHINLLAVAGETYWHMFEAFLSSRPIAHQDDLGR
jgi:fermentation-respiration switch protein FrsA (DUF1100 family)